MHNRSRTRVRRLAGAVAVIGLGLLSGPAARAQSAQPKPEVRVTTNMGSFVIELLPKRAPLTVANFLHYVRKGFYTNTLFHRVVSNFIVQGGGHEASPPYALKPTDPPVVNESGNGLENKRGTVGLARAVGPDTGNVQFYINLADNPELDPLPTRWGYAVFGKVIQGMSVVDSIGEVATGAFGPFKANAPLKPVVIESIQLISPPGLGSPQSTPQSTPSGTAAKPGAVTPPGQAGAPAGSAPPANSSTPPAKAPAAGAGAPESSKKESTKPPAPPPPPKATGSANSGS